MKKQRYGYILSLVCITLLFAVSLACDGDKDKAVSGGDETIENADATPVGEQPPPVNTEMVLETWPDDIPLMEPFTINLYTTGTESKQLVIVVPYDLVDVDEYYIDALEAEGWEEYESSEPIPETLLLTKHRKGERELSVKIRYDAENEGSFVTFIVNEEIEIEV